MLRIFVLRSANSVPIVINIFLLFLGPYKSMHPNTYICKMQTLIQVRR